MSGIGSAAFGRVVAAMVTPFDADGRLDVVATAELARFLTQPGHSDGLVVNGTTGESSTTSDAEKAEAIAAVRNAVGPDVPVTAGAGSADTRHSVRLARAAHEAGASGLLVVAPYYSRPDQAGILRHVREIADSTPLPVMLYDIPQRAGVTFERVTLLAAAQHKAVVAVKEASGDFAKTAEVRAHCDLAYFSGEDLLNLPYLAMGFAGVVSVLAHAAGAALGEMCAALDRGDLGRAREIDAYLLPLTTGMSRAPGCASAKHAVARMGVPCGDPRPPVSPLTGAERELLDADLLTVARS